MIRAVVFVLLLVIVEAARNHEVCNEYRTFEHERQCGPKGYFLAYGERYCNKFLDSVSSFDEDGRKFIRCTATCLVDSMRSYLDQHSSGTCAAIEHDAYRQHVKCYLKCGFCGACKANRRALLSVYKASDFFSFDAMRTVLSVLRKCGWGCVFV
ncbi:Stanniocalcin family protein [Aphelenchoides fujianensis]|nr:Stanniocalcin family protein [Aphelenchoides fujianensis]